MSSGHTYYWCLNNAKNGLWVAHKPAECSVKGGKKLVSDDANKKQHNTAKTTYDLGNLKPNSHLTAVLSAIKTVNFAESDSSDDSDF